MGIMDVARWRHKIKLKNEQAFLFGEFYYHDICEILYPKIENAP
jgi:hypothetical protein